MSIAASSRPSQLRRLRAVRRFFPQLVAGPIVRAKEFFPDYFNWKPPTAEEWQRGFAMILTGFVKKLVFADQFALVADRYYSIPAALPGCCRHGPAPSHSRCRFFSISPATPTSPSAWRCCSVSISRKISAGRISRPASPNSGGAGT